MSGLAKSLLAIHSRFLCQDRNFPEILLWLESVLRRKEREISPMVYTQTYHYVKPTCVCCEQWVREHQRESWMNHLLQTRPLKMLPQSSLLELRYMYMYMHVLIHFPNIDSIVGKFPGAKFRRVASQPCRRIFCNFEWNLDQMPSSWIVNSHNFDRGTRVLYNAVAKLYIATCGYGIA